MSGTTDFGPPVEEREGYQLGKLKWVGVVAELAHRSAAGPLWHGAKTSILAPHDVLRRALAAVRLLDAF